MAAVIVHGGARPGSHQLTKRPGQPVSGGWTLRNDGDRAASAQLIISSAGRAVQVSPLINLAPGERRRLNITWPVALPEGNSPLTLNVVRGDGVIVTRHDFRVTVPAANRPHYAEGTEVTYRINGGNAALAVINSVVQVGAQPGYTIYNVSRTAENLTENIREWQIVLPFRDQVQGTPVFQVGDVVTAYWSQFEDFPGTIARVFAVGDPENRFSRDEPWYFLDPWNSPGGPGVAAQSFVTNVISEA